MIAIAAVLEPWGVQSQDMFGALSAAYFGFSVGGVTLSLSSMIEAAAVFAVALFVTRMFQDWLGGGAAETRLDAGVRNSVRTIFGYVGASSPCCWPGAQIGLDVAELALIAGGLSVGIGFGLQRSPTISSPALSSCGSGASASATGSWWETNRHSRAASTPARPRSKPSIAAP